MTPSDKNVVVNLRLEYGNVIDAYSDEIIAQAWREFSQSNEYPDDKECRFPDWCEMTKANP